MKQVNLENNSVMVAMRHEKSIASVWGFMSGLGLKPDNFKHVVIERNIDTEDEFTQKKKLILNTCSDGSIDAIILATKVNDNSSESQLFEFLEEMKSSKVMQKPIVLTHLSEFSAEDKDKFGSLGLNLFYVENDNLGFPKPTDDIDTKRTGLSQLGPVIIEALK